MQQNYNYVTEDEKIEYMDFISLYPYVDKCSENPIGHPKVITSNIDFDMTKYFGMAKVKFIPPRGMYHPVLPCRSN